MFKSSGAISEKYDTFIYHMYSANLHGQCTVCKISWLNRLAQVK